MVLGAYLHEDQGDPGHAEPVAGHVFVTLVGAKGELHPWSFSPADYHQLHADRDVLRFETGVRGVVRRDPRALTMKGVRLGLFAVGQAAFRAAADEVERQRQSPPEFMLCSYQCASFAFAVLRRAGIAAPRQSVIAPRAVYDLLGNAPRGRDA